MDGRDLLEAHSLVGYAVALPRILRAHQDLLQGWSVFSPPTVGKATLSSFGPLSGAQKDHRSGDCLLDMIVLSMHPCSILAPSKDVINACNKASRWSHVMTPNIA